MKRWFMGGIASALLPLVLMGAIGAGAGAEEAEPASEPDTQEPVRLPEVVVQGRSDSLVGIAESASQGTVGATQLDERPILRPGEVLETIPGMIVTQHSGDGKANQYFLRGFNLDHGTDFATSVNGVPVNLPSHGHGQGYTDLNFMIPELIQKVHYKKGVYYADEGDFSSAGAANLQYFHVLPEGIALFTGGMYDYYRGLVADSPKLGPGNLLYAGEVLFNNGPWDVPSNFLKGNLVLGYSMGSESEGWSITGMGYKADWTSTDQIAERAVREGVIDRFGSLDDSDGGSSQRYSLSAEWHRSQDDHTTRVLAYGFYQDLDLFSNFTYFLDDPLNGDQFEQKDVRWVSGLKASHSWLAQAGPIETDNTVGLQFRNDSIRNGLYHTVDRERLSTTRADGIRETSVSPYLETREQWTEWFRSIAGVRVDIFNFDVGSVLPDNSGNTTDAIASPKLDLILGPWQQSELYLNGGMGFHSNDARGVNTTVEPGTAPPVAVNPADPLVRTYGAEIGMRTTRLRNLQSTLAFWWLDIDSELLFVGDAGTTDASRPSRRSGVEWANFYSPTEWLTLDADFAFTHTRFRGDDPTGNYIPGSPDAVIAAGITVHDLHGFFGSVRLRYFGPRPLTEDDSVRSDATLLLSNQIGYTLNETWTLWVEVFNFLNGKEQDIAYYYPSRLRNEPVGPDDGGYNDIHFHPVEPVSVRVALTAHF
jgi:hypothetical protein